MKRILIIFLLTSSLILSQDKVGTTAANFLSIPVGARASSMGGAFVALSDDVTSAFWNPSGLAAMSKNEVSIIHSEWLLDTNLDWAGLRFALDENSAVAISVYQLDYGEEEITTEEDPNGTGQNWSANDLAIGLSYARNLTDRFSIGGTAKYIRQAIWHESASAFAFDVGLLFKTEFQGFQIGMNISNFGTEMKLDGKDLLQPIDIDPDNAGNNQTITSKLDTDSWELPLLFTIGSAMKVINSGEWQFTVAADALMPNNNNSYINAGAELGWSEMLFIRGGYSSIFKNYAEEGLTAGVGLRKYFGTLFLQADFSYTDFGKFDNLLRYSLSIGF